MNMLKARLAALAVLFVLALAVQAQSFPLKPLRLIVPFSVGTPPDIVGRIVAERMQAGLGQAMVVDNRPGATGTIGLGDLLKQPADGHTVLALPMPVSVAPALYPKLAFDLRRDFEPVGQMAWSYNVLVVHPEVKAASAKELLELLKANPGSFSFGSGGNGTPAHLAAELWKQQYQFAALHVPYVQFPQAIGDLVAGRLHFMFLASAPAIAQVNGGKLRPLAVTGLVRLPALKDVPTMLEAGFPDFVVRDWQGLIVRAGSPKEAVMRLNSELAKVMALPDVQAQLAKMGNEPATGTPEEFAKLVDSEIDRWAKVVRAAGVKVD